MSAWPAPPSYRPEPGSIPTQPGVYRFRDAQGRVIYVGKAKNLRARLSSYFQDIGNLHPRTATMVTTAASVEWTVVKTEVEALQLEYSWIKEFDPRFNVKYRDDKSYPWLAVTVGEEFPRVMVGRGAKRKGTRYFGPYCHAWAIRETVDLLLRVFPMRSCSNGVFKRSGQIGRPCLLGYIDKCAAPCVGSVTAEEHRAIVDDFCDFMAGQHHGRSSSASRRRCTPPPRPQDFEKAARLRDDLGALQQGAGEAGGGARRRHRRRRDRARRGPARGRGPDLLRARRPDPRPARLGRRPGRRGRHRRAGRATSCSSCTPASRRRRDPARDPGAGAAARTPRRSRSCSATCAGAGCAIRVPQRGDKKTLQETVARNAGQSLRCTRPSAPAT